MVFFGEMGASLEVASRPKFSGADAWRRITNPDYGPISQTVVIGRFVSTAARTSTCQVGRRKHLPVNASADIEYLT
jgi:hypothetical protein